MGRKRGVLGRRFEVRGEVEASDSIFLDGHDFTIGPGTCGIVAGKVLSKDGTGRHCLLALRLDISGDMYFVGEDQLNNLALGE